MNDNKEGKYKVEYTETLPEDVIDELEKGVKDLKECHGCYLARKTNTEADLILMGTRTENKKWHDSLCDLHKKSCAVKDMGDKI